MVEAVLIQVLQVRHMEVLAVHSDCYGHKRI